MHRFNVFLALVAGLAGGVSSRYLWPQAVQAQAQTPMEIRARSFILEDADGKVLGTFSGVTTRGLPTASGSLRLFDNRGREIWRNPSNGVFPATE
jgi:hypothetical protein